jgi:hypothetical protein
MKKNRYNLLAATLCVAGLSLCMLNVAKAESSPSPDASLAANSFTPVGTSPDNVVIPEPTTTACTLLGLGVLVTFRYLKNGRRI